MDQFEQWRKDATPERQEGRVCLDREAKADLMSTLAELSEVMNPKLIDQPDTVEELAEEAKRLDAKVDESTRTFVFGRIPRGRWREIEDDHPASEHQRETNPKQQLDPDTFGPAVAAECCVEPGLTIEQAEWLADFLPDREWEEEVLGPILRANQTGSERPKGVSGIADRLISELRSITQPETGSPSRSSEDG